MKQKNGTKQTIFKAAAELFADRGFHAVSIQDIAKRVGIGKSAIYNHYPSKESILDALLDYYLKRMDLFYEKIQLSYNNLPENEDLRTLLKQLIFNYTPEETELMFHVTRIIHHEQFNFHKAADALMGTGYRKLVDEYESFFNALTEAGYLSNGMLNHTYGELFARITRSFAMQFLHPEFEYAISIQDELLEFMIDRVVSDEQIVAG